jgi:hypothetical protein
MNENIPLGGSDAAILTARTMIYIARETRNPAVWRGLQAVHGRLDGPGYSLTSILPFIAGCRPQM